MAAEIVEDRSFSLCPEAETCLSRLGFRVQQKTHAYIFTERFHTIAEMNNARLLS